MARARRVDENHSDISKALREAGAFVVDTSALPGFVDLVAGFQGRTYLVEVKRPAGPKGGTSGRQLTPDQRRLHESWRGGPLVVVRSVEEAMEAVCKKP